MHIIDNSSKGADGLRVLDINSDGFSDLIAGFEEGGEVKLYINQKTQFKTINVMKVKDVEGVTFGDFNSDGVIDIVSFSEGDTREINLAIGSKDFDSWEQHKLPAPKLKWMDGVVFDVNKDGKLDIIAGSKDEAAKLVWLENTGDNFKKWKYHEIDSVGWLMSIQLIDLNFDGSPDLFISDRKGADKGLKLYDISNNFHKTYLATDKNQFMFSNIILEKNYFLIAQAMRSPTEVKVRKISQKENNILETIPVKSFSKGALKAARLVDIDQDNQLDLIVAYTGILGGGKIIQLKRLEGGWQKVRISGGATQKFDDITLVDMDFDGDLDILTTEEWQNKGVIWFENPLFTSKQVPTHQGP